MSSSLQAAFPRLSHLVLGAVFMTQASSIRTLSLIVDATDFTGADAAMLVGSDADRVG